jgi:chitin synthase
VKKDWDVFTNHPPVIITGSMADQTCIQLSLQIVKVLAYIFTFIFVLGGAVLSKGTLLFMTSQLRTSTTIKFCSAVIGNYELSLHLPYFGGTTWAYLNIGCLFSYLTNHPRADAVVSVCYKV